MAGSYQEYRYYSLAHDCEVARLSLFDTHGQEYHATVPTENGKRWRERRALVLDLIEDAMRVQDPGAVEIGVEAVAA